MLAYACQLVGVPRVRSLTRREIALQVHGAAAVVGIATALACTPDVPRRWRDGEDIAPAVQEIGWEDKVLGAFARMALAKRRLLLLGANRTEASGFGTKIKPNSAENAERFINKVSHSRESPHAKGSTNMLNASAVTSGISVAAYFAEDIHDSNWIRGN